MLKIEHFAEIPDHDSIITRIGNSKGGAMKRNSIRPAESFLIHFFPVVFAVEGEIGLA